MPPEFEALGLNHWTIKEMSFVYFVIELFIFLILHFKSSLYILGVPG